MWKKAAHSVLYFNGFISFFFSEENYDAFCLAYMFTYRDFEGGTLGLAWTGDMKNAGGVCERNGVSWKKNAMFFFSAVNLSYISLSFENGIAAVRMQNKWHVFLTVGFYIFA